MQPPVPPLPAPINQKNNELAVAAGWLGIGSIIAVMIGFGFSLSNAGVSKFFQTIAGLACLTGFVLGIIGLVQIRKNPGQKGRGMAITGIVIGAFSVCIVPLLAIFTLLGPVVGSAVPGISGTLVAP